MTKRMLDAVENALRAAHDAIVSLHRRVSALEQAADSRASSRGVRSKPLLGGAAPSSKGETGGQAATGRTTRAARRPPSK
jgi:hypothetical protein